MQKVEQKDQAAPNRSAHFAGPYTATLHFFLFLSLYYSYKASGLSLITFSKAHALGLLKYNKR
jgi:hypothetical protein